MDVQPVSERRTWKPLLMPGPCFVAWLSLQGVLPPAPLWVCKSQGGSAAWLDSGLLRWPCFPSFSPSMVLPTL